MNKIAENQFLTRSEGGPKGRPSDAFQLSNLTELWKQNSLVWHFGSTLF